MKLLDALTYNDFRYFHLLCVHFHLSYIKRVLIEYVCKSIVLYDDRLYISKS